MFINETMKELVKDVEKPIDEVNGAEQDSRDPRKINKLVTKP